MIRGNDYQPDAAFRRCSTELKSRNNIYCVWFLLYAEYVFQMRLFTLCETVLESAEEKKWVGTRVVI